MNDSELLQQFTQGSNPAFAELVQRHLDFVFAVAVRHVGGDRHRAEDIVQQVFTDLARKARALTRHPTLAGWLYASTRYTAIDAVRREQRRAQREQHAEATKLLESESTLHWEQLRPVIDDALEELDEQDRESVLLRFFGKQPFAAIAAQFGTSENAAQKRVARALDQLGSALKRRGISSTAGALGLALANSSVAAPGTLAGTVAATAISQAAGVGIAVWTATNGLKIAAALAALSFGGLAWRAWSKPTASSPPQTPTLASIRPNPARTESPPRSIAAESSPTPIQLNRAELKSSAVPFPASNPKPYAVRPGDTLRRIAADYSVTVEALRAENPGYDFIRMRVGENILLPTSAKDPAPPPEPTVPIPADQAYVIQRGDSLGIIAQKTGLTPDELRQLNPQTNWARLRTGQIIRVP